MPSPPPIDLLLAGWWGTGAASSFNAAITNAANIVQGGNPLYQISDFLAFYPKFGTGTLAMLSAQLNSVGGSGGSGYVVGDTLNVVQEGGAGGQLAVATIGGGGAVLTFTVSAGGGGYRVGSALPTTGGTGTGCVIDITGVEPPVLNANLPLPVLQAFINLAAASLSFNRWTDTWEFGMALYIAHFVTLYIRSEGSAGTTAGQIAASGLEKGILVSKGANSVSAGLETVSNDLMGWGALRETTYGVQLASLAKVIGAGPMYVW